MAPLFLVLAEKGKEGKTSLFFKTCFPSFQARKSVAEEIHPALQPAEIKGYQGQVEFCDSMIYVFAILPLRNHPWKWETYPCSQFRSHDYQNPVKFFLVMEKLQKYFRGYYILYHILIINHGFTHNRSNADTASAVRPAKEKAEEKQYSEGWYSLLDSGYALRRKLSKAERILQARMSALLFLFFGSAHAQLDTALSRWIRVLKHHCPGCRDGSTA